MHPLGVSDMVWSAWAVPYVLSNLLAFALLIIALARPGWARAAFALLFAGAGLFNLATALTRPSVYLGFAQWAVAPVRHFIEGPMSQGPALIVGPIALFQLACALMLALGDRRTARQGALGAATFCAALTLLGFGSAFPATLTLCGAALVTWGQMPRTPPLHWPRIGHGVGSRPA